MKRKLQFLQRMAARGMLHFNGNPEDQGGGGGSPGDLPQDNPGGTQGSDDGADKGEGQGEDQGQGSDKGKEQKGDGKSSLSDADAKLLKENMRQKKTIETLQSQNAQLTQLKEALGDLTPDQIKAFVEEKAQREIKELEDKQQYEAIVTRIKDENAKVVQSLQEKLDAAEAEKARLNGVIEDLTVGRAFAESAFVREKTILPASLARKEFGAHFDIVDGVVTGFDKPRGASDRVPLLDAQGNPKSFDDALQELVSKHAEAPRLLRSTQRPGSGSNTTDVPKNARIETKQRTPLEKIRTGLKNLAQNS